LERTGIKGTVNVISSDPKLNEAYQNTFKADQKGGRNRRLKSDKF